MTIQQQMQQQAMTGRPMDERITSLEVRVGGIEDGIKTIVGKLDSRDRVPWGVIGTFAGLVLTVIASIGGLAFRPLGDGIADLKASLVKIEARSERYVPREDLDNRFGTITQRRDDLQRLTDARIERVERDVDTVQKMLVPRGEHDERAASQRQKDDGLQRQIDDLRKGQADLNTPRDAFIAMQRRIDELERGRRPPG